MKLLIAEDDPDMQKILKLYLQREGCQVNIVDNGRAAIDFFVRESGGSCDSGLDDTGSGWYPDP